MFYLIDLNELRRTHSGRLKPRSADDQFVLPNVYEKLTDLKSTGHFLIGISDHQAVSFREKTEAQAWAIEIALNNSLGEVFNDMRINCYAGDGISKARFIDRRWSSSFFIDEILEDYGLNTKENVRIVGASAQDHELSKASGISLIYSWQFFDWDSRILERDGMNYIWTKEALEAETAKSKVTALNFYDREKKPIGSRLIPKNSIVQVPKGILTTCDINAIG